MPPCAAENVHMNVNRGLLQRRCDNGRRSGGCKLFDRRRVNHCVVTATANFKLPRLARGGVDMHHAVIVFFAAENNLYRDSVENGARFCADSGLAEISGKPRMPLPTW